MAETLLEIIGLSVASNGVRLLHGLDFRLEAGEIMALAGPSGCGKTTLLRTLSGLIDPAEGMFRFKGVFPEAMGWPRYRRTAILVEQRPVVFDTTVAENLARPFRYRTAAAAFDPEKAKTVLEALGVGAHRMEQAARSLSVGQQLRVCLARALLLEPGLLFLDEPTSALDEASAERVADFLRMEAATHGLAVLVATHDRALAERWGPRVLDLAPYAAAPAGKEEAHG